MGSFKRYSDSELAAIRARNIAEREPHDAADIEITRRSITDFRLSARELSKRIRFVARTELAHKRWGGSCFRSGGLNAIIESMTQQEVIDMIETLRRDRV